MAENSNTLPEGAGSTTSNNAFGSDTGSASSSAVHGSPTIHGSSAVHGSSTIHGSSAVHGAAGGAQVQSFAGGYSAGNRQDTGYSSYSGRELITVEERTRPSTAKVVGAALAGAIVGGAIPFMLRTRAGGTGTNNSSTQREETVTESIIINRPARELYDFWRNFENLSQFMDNIKSVQKLDQKRSHWVIKAPAGTSVEFDSRVTDEVPGRLIAWESEPGASVPNRGRVEFIETASGTGTNVRTTISYDPPAGAAGRLVAKLFQREPSVQAREDLARFKRLMETGRADG
jgi:uncharacterized membrane protein